MLSNAFTLKLTPILIWNILWLDINNFQLYFFSRVIEKRLIQLLSFDNHIASCIALPGFVVNNLSTEWYIDDVFQSPALCTWWHSYAATCTFEYSAVWLGRFRCWNRLVLLRRNELITVLNKIWIQIGRLWLVCKDYMHMIVSISSFLSMCWCCVKLVLCCMLVIWLWLWKTL